MYRSIKICLLVKLQNYILESLIDKRIKSFLPIDCNNMFQEIGVVLLSIVNFISYNNDNYDFYKKKIKIYNTKIINARKTKKNISRLEKESDNIEYNLCFSKDNIKRASSYLNALIKEFQFLVAKTNECLLRGSSELSSLENKEILVSLIEKLHKQTLSVMLDKILRTLSLKMFLIINIWIK